MFPIEKVAAPPSVRRTVFAGALGNGEGKEKKTLSCSQGKKMRVTVVLENVHFNYRTSVLIRRKKKITRGRLAGPPFYPLEGKGVFS